MDPAQFHGRHVARAFGSQGAESAFGANFRPSLDAKQLVAFVGRRYGY